LEIFNQKGKKPVILLDKITDIDPEHSTRTIRMKAMIKTPTDKLEHETGYTVFKNAYIFSKAEERIFAEKQHLRQA
jgi:hypothetical protein